MVGGDLRKDWGFRTGREGSEGTGRTRKGKKVPERRRVVAVLRWGRKRVRFQSILRGIEKEVVRQEKNRAGGGSAKRQQVNGESGF